MSFWEQLRSSLFASYRDQKTIVEVRRKLSGRSQLDSDSFATTFFPEEKRTIARKLWEITREHSVADITGLQPGDTFNGDLKMDDLDSLSLVELVVHLEKDFGVNISEERAQSINSFNDLVDEIFRLKNSSHSR